MTHAELREHANKILLGLVDFYLDKGLESATYQDEARGGLYENKLAVRLGYREAPGPLPPPEFIAAAISLEKKGYVRRIERVDGQALRGIWPTDTGIARAEFLRANVFQRVTIALRDNEVAVFISVITALLTTVLTVALMAFLGLFGLKG